MKKRFLSLILVLFTVFAVSGCSVRSISDTTTAETTTGVIDESTVNVTLEQFRKICEDNGMTVYDSTEYDKGEVYIAEGNGLHAQYYIHYNAEEVDKAFSKLLVVCSRKFNQESYDSVEFDDEYYGTFMYNDSVEIYASYRSTAILYVTNITEDGIGKVKDFAESIKY